MALLFFQNEGEKMKKTLLMFLFIIFVIAGCSNGNVDNNNTNDNQVNNNEVNDDNNTNNNNDMNENETNNNENEANNNETTNNDNDASLETMLKEESEAFFAAQLDKDIDAINGFLASSATYDEDADIFYFDEIALPHEMERFEIEEADLEYRYFNDEGEDGPIVGFASVNYEEEYSFVLDLTWIEEEGSWKVLDMDMNK